MQRNALSDLVGENPPQPDARIGEIMRPAYGIVRVRPISLQETVSGCRSCLVTTQTTDGKEYNRILKQHLAAAEEAAAAAIAKSSNASAGKKPSDKEAGKKGAAANSRLKQEGANRQKPVASKHQDPTSPRDSDGGVVHQPQEPPTRPVRRTMSLFCASPTADTTTIPAPSSVKSLQEQLEELEVSIKGGITAQRKRPTNGRIEARSFRCTQCLAPERVSAPVLELVNGKESVVTKVFTCHPTQTKVYDSFSGRAITAAMSGERSVVVCFGSTGSGKHHTVFGNNNDPGIVHHLLGELMTEYGKGSRRCQELYHKLEKQHQLLHHSSPQRQSYVDSSTMPFLRDISYSLFDIDATDQAHDLLCPKSLSDPDVFAPRVVSDSILYIDEWQEAVDAISASEGDAFDGVEDNVLYAHRSESMGQFMENITSLSAGVDPAAASGAIDRALALRRAKLEYQYATNRSTRLATAAGEVVAGDADGRSNSSADEDPTEKVVENAQATVDIVAPSEYLSTATTVLRVELHICGGKSDLGEELDDKIGVIDVVCCPGAEHLNNDHLKALEREAKQRAEELNLARLQALNPRRPNHDAQRSLPPKSSANNNVTFATAHQQQHHHQRHTPEDRFGVPFVEEEDGAALLTNLVLDVVPMRSLTSLFHSISKLSITTGNAAAASAEIRRLVKSSFLTMYLGAVLMPPPADELGSSQSSTSYLDGNLFVIGTTSSADGAFDEIVTTLHFVDAATKIATFPKVCIDRKKEYAAQLEAEIVRTREQLQLIEEGAMGHGPSNGGGGLNRMASMSSPMGNQSMNRLPSRRKLLQSSARSETSSAMNMPLAYSAALLGSRRDMSSSARLSQPLLSLHVAQQQGSGVGQSLGYDASSRVLAKVEVLKRLAAASVRYKSLTQSKDDRRTYMESERLSTMAALEYCCRQFNMVLVELAFWGMCASMGAELQYRRKLEGRMAAMQRYKLGNLRRARGLSRSGGNFADDSGLVREEVHEDELIITNAAGVFLSKGAADLALVDGEEDDLALSLLSKVETLYPYALPLASTYPMLLPLNHTTVVPTSSMVDVDVGTSNNGELSPSIPFGSLILRPSIILAQEPTSNAKQVAKSSNSFSGLQPMIDQLYPLYPGGTPIGNMAAAFQNGQGSLATPSDSLSRRIGRSAVSHLTRSVAVPWISATVAARIDVDLLRQDVRIWGICSEDIASHTGNSQQQHPQKSSTFVLVNGISVDPVSVAALPQAFDPLETPARPSSDAPEPSMMAEGLRLSHGDTVVIDGTVAFKVMLPPTWEEVKALVSSPTTSSPLVGSDASKAVVTIPLPSGVEVGSITASSGELSAYPELEFLRLFAQPSPKGLITSRHLSPSLFLRTVHQVARARLANDPSGGTSTMSNGRLVLTTANGTPLLNSSNGRNAAGARWGQESASSSLSSYISPRHIQLVERYNRTMTHIEEVIFFYSNIQQVFLQSSATNAGVTTASLAASAAMAASSTRFAYASYLVETLTTLGKLEDTLIREFGSPKLLVQGALLTSMADALQDIATAGTVRGEVDRLNNALSVQSKPKRLEDLGMFRVSAEMESRALATRDEGGADLQIGPLFAEEEDEDAHPPANLNEVQLKQLEQRRVLKAKRSKLRRELQKGFCNAFCGPLTWVSTMDAVYRSILERKLTDSDAAMALAHRNNTIFAFLNPAAAHEFASSLTPAEAERVIAIKQRMFAHVKRHDGAGPGAGEGALEAIAELMGTRRVRELLSPEEMALLRKYVEDQHNQRQLAALAGGKVANKKFTDAELLELARRNLASPNPDASKMLDALRFRLDHEIKAYQRELQKSMVWLDDGPLNPPRIRKEYLAILIEKEPKPTLADIRKDKDLDVAGGVLIPGDAGGAAKPFEAYFYKLRVRRTVFHRDGGFHRLYGVLRGRFFYYFYDNNPQYPTQGGVYLLGARVEKTTTGTRRYCISIKPCCRRKESKDNEGPKESEVVISFDTESELLVWYEKLCEAAYPPMTPLLEQFFGLNQLNRFVEDAGLLALIQAEKNSKVDDEREARDANRAAGGASSASLSASQRMASSVVEGSGDAEIGGLEFRLPKAQAAKHRSKAIMASLSTSLSNSAIAAVNQISRKQTRLRIGELDGAKLTPDEEHAVTDRDMELRFSHSLFGGAGREETVKQEGAPAGADASLMLISSPSDRLILPITVPRVIPAYEKDQIAYSLIAGISGLMEEAPKRLSNVGTPSSGIRISNVYNGKELKSYFRTSLTPIEDPPVTASSPTSPQRSSSGRTKNANSERAKREALQEAQGRSRLWMLDLMGGLIQLIDVKKQSAVVFEDRQLMRLEPSPTDSTLLHMTFFHHGHHIFSEYFPSYERRQHFYMLAQMIRPSCRPYCPPLSSPPPNTYTMLYTVPGEKIEVISGKSTQPLIIEGECQVRVSDLPTQAVSVWTGTFNVAGLPMHHPDVLEKWIPLDDKYDIYAISIQDASYRKGEGQLISFLQRYFEDPNPPRYSAIVNAVGGNVLGKHALTEDPKKGADDGKVARRAKDVKLDANLSSVVSMQRKGIHIDNEKIRAMNDDEEVRNKPRYRLVASSALFDLQVLVFCRTDLWMGVSNVETTCTPLSVECFHNERGAAAVAFDLHGSSFCFAGVHLPGLRTPEQDALRRALINDVLTSMSLAGKSLCADLPSQFDFFFMFGDFNYPLKRAVKQTVAHIHEAHVSNSIPRFVRDHDSLISEISAPPQKIASTDSDGSGNGGESVDLFAMLPSASNLVYDVSGRVLNTGLVLSGFREPEIQFLPTYCTDVGTAKYNLSKVLGPNYPDRILVKGAHFMPPRINEKGEEIKLLELEEEEDLEKRDSDDDKPEEEEEGAAAGGPGAGEATEGNEPKQSALVAATQLESAQKLQKQADASKKRGMGGESPLYPLTCSSYTACRDIRLSDHFPVSAVFQCHIVRPIASVFMREARRAVITISGLKVTGVTFVEGPPRGSQAYNARSIESLVLQLSIKNYVETVDVESEKLLTKAVPGSLTGQMFSATFPSPIQLTPTMPTTPDHMACCNLFLAVYDGKDPDHYRSRRGATRLALANIAGPIEFDVLKEIQLEPEWPLMEVPFKVPLELAGTRCGVVKGTMQITYERLDGDDYDE